LRHVPRGRGRGPAAGEHPRRAPVAARWPAGPVRVGGHAGACGRRGVQRRAAGRERAGRASCVARCASRSGNGRASEASDRSMSNASGMSNEFARIAALIAGLPAGAGVVVGPGDDAAVLRLAEGRDLVATTDAAVEGRHFRRDVLSPEEAGTRLAAADLSDLAAMAAQPRWALISLVAPANWSGEDCRRLEHACARTLFAEGAALVGGNLASADGPLVASLTLLGEVERGRAWTRRGARAGDLIAVTGAPGSAAAFLALALWGNPPARRRAPAA